MEPTTHQNNNKNLPPLRFATRGKEGFQMFVIESGHVTKDNRFNFTNCRAMLFSQTGSVLCLVLEDSVELFDVDDARQISKISKEVAYAVLSPLGTYLLTWSRPPSQPQGAQADPEKEKGGERPKEADNLIVWEVASGKRVWSAFQKLLKRDNWPTIQWSADERYAGRMVNNQIEFYLGNQLGTIVKKKQLPSLYQWSFSPVVSKDNDQLCYAAFVLGKNTTPSSLSLFKFSNQETISSKSFFHVQSVDFLWNPTGTALIAQTQADVDRTGKSYYGETGLYFFTIDGKTSEQVQLKKEGHVHHCSWAPNSKEFLVIYGFMPALATKFDLQLNPIADFGAAHRNSAFWSPHGRLLCIAGFGNLQGDMDIWDHKRVKKLGKTQAHCAAYCGWSPDSNYLLTAVLSPRIRVDNGFKVHSNSGTLLFQQGSAELFEVLWRPTLPGLYPEPPPIKSTMDTATTTTTTTTTTATTTSDASSPWAPSGATAAPAAKPGVYRHPHFSQQSSTFRKDDDTGPMKYNRGVGRGNAPAQPSAPAPKEYLPPGYTPEVPKKKNKNRRKNKKPNQNESGADGTNDGETEDSSQETDSTTTTTSNSQDSETSTGTSDDGSAPSRGRGRGRGGRGKGEGGAGRGDAGRGGRGGGGQGGRGGSGQGGRGGRGRGRGEAPTVTQIEEPSDA